MSDVITAEVKNSPSDTLLDKVGNNLSFKYYGNYGGPGYTGGKYGSNDFSLPPVDSLDEGFRRHDFDYGVMDKGRADRLFLRYMDKEWAPNSESERLAGGLAYTGFAAKSGRYSDADLLGTYPWVEVKKSHAKNRLSKLIRKKVPKEEKAAAVGNRFLKKDDMPPKKGGKKFKKNVKKEIKKEVKRDLAPVRKWAFRGYRPGMGRGRWRGRGRRQGFISGSYPDREIKVSAPVQMGRKGAVGAGITFYDTRKPGCVGLVIKVYVGQMGAYTDNASHTFGAWQTPSGQIDQNVFVMPQNTHYVGSCTNLSTMVQMFERWKAWTRLRYKNGCTTNTNGTFKFMFFDDPNSLYQNTGKTGTFPQSGTFGGAVYANNYSVAQFWECSPFAPVITSVRTDMRGDPLKHVGAPNYTTQMDPSAYTPEELERCVGGLWTVSGTNLPANSANTFNDYGELWLHYKIELCNMMPETTSTTLGAISSSSSSGSVSSTPSHVVCPSCNKGARQIVRFNQVSVDRALRRIERLENLLRAEDDEKLNALKECSLVEEKTKPKSSSRK